MVEREPAEPPTDLSTLNKGLFSHQFSQALGLGAMLTTLIFTARPLQQTTMGRGPKGFRAAYPASCQRTRGDSEKLLVIAGFDNATISEEGMSGLAPERRPRS
jgi:hypothetical protein